MERASVAVCSGASAVCSRGSRGSECVSGVLEWMGTGDGCAVPPLPASLWAPSQRVTTFRGPGCWRLSGVVPAVLSCAVIRWWLDSAWPSVPAAWRRGGAGAAWALPGCREASSGHGRWPPECVVPVEAVLLKGRDPESRGVAPWVRLPWCGEGAQGPASGWEPLDLTARRAGSGYRSACLWKAQAVGLRRHSIQPQAVGLRRRSIQPQAVGLRRRSIQPGGRDGGRGGWSQ